MINLCMYNYAITSFTITAQSYMDGQIYTYIIIHYIWLLQL